MNSNHRQPLRSQAKAVTRREEESASRFRRLLAISIMSALTLSAILLAKAETWVIINEDGSVSRTETHSQAQVTPDASTSNTRANKSRTSDSMRAYDNAVSGSGHQSPNTTFFAGNYYPVPSYSYSYPTPGGITYPVGPVFPNVTPPMVTTLPGTATVTGYGYPPVFAYPPVPYYPPVYPYPVYSYPAYPVYGGTGVFYSGPAGGGGTIYSSTTTSDGGYGLSVGKKGVHINLGNTTSSTTSTTTITTTGPSY